MLLNKAKYLSLVALIGLGGCAGNQYVTNSSGGYDDLYGGNSGPVAVNADIQNSDQAYSRSNNPEYQQSYENTQGTADYYDENYLTTRSVTRNVSGDVGYNSGFVDGYNQASMLSNPYRFGGMGYNGFGSYYPASRMGLSLMFGFGNGFRMSPYMSYGSMLSYGYSPYGYDMMGMYDPWGYSSFGYNPWGYGGMYGGYGLYNSYYGGGYYGGPVVVVNNYDRPGLARNYGPRVASNGSIRRSERSNNNFVNSSRSGSDAVRSTRRSSSTGETAGYTRSNRTANTGSGRVSGENGYSSRSYNSTDGGNTYYSRPRSSGNTYYSNDAASSANYSSRSSRSGYSDGSSSYSAPTRSQSNYSAPTRSQSNYSTPGRSSNSYNSPSRSEYSAPTRSNNNYSAPSYSAPSRSYSAPSSGGGASSGGGGGARSSSRGPR